MSPLKDNPIKEIYGVEDVLAVECEAAPQENEGLEALREKTASCTKCPLHKNRTNPVFSDGSPNADIMFIGEGPGAEEDKQGKPFVGRAGKLLTKMIEAMGLSREEVYIANIVKCRPPENRAPFAAEAEQCIPYLYKQIKLVQPRIIICLGSVSAHNLLSTKTPIGKLRGEFIELNGIKVMPTYHPAFLLRSPNMKKFAWADLQAVMKEAGIK